MTFVEPSAEAAAKVVAGSPRAEGAPDVDMAIDIDRTTTESRRLPDPADVLPDRLPVLRRRGDRPTVVKDYLAYIVSTEGQQAAADEAGSAPLDSSLQHEAAGIVDKISAG